MTRAEFQTFIHATHTTPKVLRVGEHSFYFHSGQVFAQRGRGGWYNLGTITHDGFETKSDHPFLVTFDWMLAQEEFECTVHSKGHRQTRYRVRREPAHLIGGPFDGATVWLDDATSLRTTAPFRVGTHYGYYQDKQWRNL